MSVFVVAQLKFTDESRYRRYQEKFAPVFSKFGGTLICADENPKPLEGQPDCDKVVIMSFGNERRAKEFFESPDYRSISKDREAGANTVSVMVREWTVQ